MSQLRLSFLLPLVAFGILALVGGMALYGTLSGSRDPTQLPSVLVDKPAPQTNLPRLAQTGSATVNNVSVTMFQGKPVLCAVTCEESGLRSLRLLRRRLHRASCPLRGRHATMKPVAIHDHGFRLTSSKITKKIKISQQNVKGNYGDQSVSLNWARANFIILKKNQIEHPSGT